MHPLAPLTPKVFALVASLCAAAALSGTAGPPASPGKPSTAEVMRANAKQAEMYGMPRFPGLGVSRPVAAD